MKPGWRACHLCAIVAILLVATSPSTSHPADGHANEEQLLDRIAIIGASATAGWGVVLRYVDKDEFLTTRTIQMKDVVEEVVQVDESEVHGTGSGLFFWNPVAIGKTQVGEALEFEPTLVLALDFLFWYGYGDKDATGKAIPRGMQGKEARLSLLEQGLENLDTFNCPVVVGDFPDVSDAIGYMLSPSQVPSPTTLKALNDRVRAWAASRSNVTVIPLARLMQSMRSNEVFMAGQNEWPEGAKSRFMQRDNLHPTLDGLIVLVQEAGNQLATGSAGIDPSQLDFELTTVRDRLYESRRPEMMTSKPYTGTD